MSKYQILDGHPVPYSLTVQADGQSVIGALPREAVVEAERFATAKGMQIDKWEGAYAFYSPKSEPEQHIITRTGQRPLKFKGELIGKGDTHSHQGPNQNRWTEVYLYRTKGGKWIAQVSHRTCWQGEHDTEKAESFATPAELVAWLTDDNDGALGRASNEACEEAAKADPEFAKAFVEEIE